MVVTAYVALLRKQADSDFGVEFPDFPGYITAGVALEDARFMAMEALLFHVEGLIQDGSPIPKPSKLYGILADLLCSKGATFHVNIATSCPQLVQINRLL